jgi:alkylation response protein AidB-like acyl-CoA dehydrogenase
VDFELGPVELSWREKGTALGREVARDPAAATVVQAAARAGLLDPAVDLLAVAVAAEAIAEASPAAAAAYALHSSIALTLATGGSASSSDAPANPRRADRVLGRTPPYDTLFRGETVAAVGLSSDEIPVEQNGRLSGGARWVAPITDRGVAVVGPQSATERVAYIVALDAPGVRMERVEAAGLAGLVCGHVRFAGVSCQPIGATPPIMTRVRILMAAVGLGIGRRALRAALVAAKAARTAAAGEQTVQGLLADAATDLDAAMLMTWKAASAGALSLVDASLAKLMTTSAAQRAVERATQVIGADSFERGHLLERLAQDVRALELFAGRTEALRAAAAEELLPRV